MADYVCTLSDHDLEKAKKELHEDPANRLGAVAELRRWIDKDAAHLSCPTDDAFLLRFLRNAKFSQLVAREKLENFYKKFTNEPLLLDKIDKLDTRSKLLQDVWRAQVSFALPNRLPGGERIMMIRPGTLEALIKKKKVDFKPHHIFWAGIATMEYLLRDEATQVNGVVMIQDFTGVSPALITWMKPERMRLVSTIYERGTPVRLKQMNFYNGGTIFDIIMSIVGAFLSNKLKSRIRNHGSNLETIYDVIPMNCLPDEYLPDEYDGPSAGSVESCVERHIENMTKDDVRAHIMHVTDGSRFGVDESKRVKAAAASFRKLAVD